MSGHAAGRLNRLTIGLVVLALAVVVADRLIPDGSPGKDERNSLQAESTGAAAPLQADQADQASDDLTEAVPSVAVLPFANMSPDPDNEYFADGISEELLNVLVKVESLRVPSRTSSFAFKGQNLDIREIANRLEVNHILEGSVRKAGNQVRITAQLIDVETDTHLWSETYDRGLEDIFGVQDEIAGHIVAALKLVLDADLENQKPTENLEAYTLFLQGRFLFQKRDEHLIEAERLLSAAVELDPDFAEAWGLLAMLSTMKPNYLSTDPVAAYEQARVAASNALALQPGQAEARLAVTQNLAQSNQHAKALEQFRQTVTANPRHSTAQLWYAIGLMRSGYSQEALIHNRKAVELDPVSGLILDWYARNLIMAGRWREALAPAERAIPLGRRQARVALAQYYLLADDPRGWQAFKKYYEPDDSFIFLSDLYQITESTDKLATAQRMINRITFENPLNRAYARFNTLALTDESALFFEQARIIHQLDDTILANLWFPSVSHHRQSEEMKTFAREMGMVDLWRERGWPDLCRPLGDEDFECD